VRGERPSSILAFNVNYHTSIHIVLPGYDRHGRKVVVQRLSLVDPSRVGPDDSIRVTSMISELVFKEPSDLQANVCGVVLISDIVGTSMGHMKLFSPTQGKKLVTIFEEMYPSRPKAMHYLNMPAFVEATFNMIKGFMKPKIRERIKVHPKNDLSKLQEELGLDVLPVDYGGRNGTLAEHAAKVAEHTFANRDYLMAQAKFKSNEKKRVGVPKTYSDIFGMVGSFRQLEVD